MADNKNVKEETKPAMLAENESLTSDSQIKPFKTLIEKEPVLEPEVAKEGLISSPEPVADGKPTITYDTNGVISSGKTKEKSAKAVSTKKLPEPKTVALFSDRNVHWQGVGKVVKGYNIVSEEASVMWLTRNHVRLVDPKEIKQEFDN